MIEQFLGTLGLTLSPTTSWSVKMRAKSVENFKDRVRELTVPICLEYTGAESVPQTSTPIVPAIPRRIRMPPSSSVLEPTAAAPPLPPECLPNYDLIITEDDTPVDSLISEREMKLLTDPLHASWAGPGEGRSFVCMTNVGLFFALKKPPLVPDFLLSLDVEMPEDVLLKENRSYFLWNYGKPPDLVVEIVSNKEGGEADVKWRKYAQLGITYYVIHDPLNELEGGVLRAFTLRGGVYEPMDAAFFPLIGLGLTLWHGHYAGMRAEWLRWCDRSGRLLLTGAERAIQAEQRLDQEQQRADQEQQRAAQEQQRADQEQQRAERLAAQLRSLGIEPAE